ncbi:MAG: AbgT family transporter [Fusobacteriaceae bacterium]
MKNQNDVLEIEEQDLEVGPESSKGFLAWIEKVGNKMPHPLAMFLWIIGIVMVLSFLVSKAGVTAISPNTGEVIAVKNLISLETLIDFMKNFTPNFQKFPVLGTVVILATASGFAEKVGLFKTLIRMFLKDVRGNKIVFIAAFIAACGQMFGDSAFLVIPLIIAALFKGVNRHPVAGLVLGFAAVGGGYGSAVIPGGWDLILTPITINAAKLIDTNFDMTYMSGYYYTFAATFIIATTAAFVTIKFIEPRLGKYIPEGEEADEDEEALTEDQKTAGKKALIGLGLFLLTIFIMCVPQSSPFRSPEGSLVFKAPLMSSLQTIIVLFFFIPAAIYSKATKQVTTMKELAAILSEAVKGVAPFIVLSIVISQFLAFFASSNLGTILAIKGGEFLNSLSVPTVIICMLFLILVSFINLFIVSGSAKYLIFGPVFVPMLMQLGIHPAFTQVLYRMGDAMTNHLSPLNAFFVILLTLIQKYDKNVGMGTIFSYMVPYAIAYSIVISLFSLLWMSLGFAPGIGSTLWM